MRYIMLPFFAFAITFSKANNYYFSASIGEDLRTTLQASRPATPWQTLQKLNSIFTTLRPGDSVFLKRGDVFFGTINITRSGTQNLPIYIGAYGAGNKPTVTGFLEPKWSLVKNNIYESNSLADVSTVNIVAIKNQPVAMGRYPNSDYLTINSHDEKTSITCDQLNSAIDWTNAELVVRSRRWILDRNLITSQNGSTLYYSTSSRYGPYDKFGFFIQNSSNTLDKEGEWYYDPGTKKIMLYSLSKPASVRVCVLDSLISSSGSSYIIFNNLSISGANKTAITFNNGSNIQVINCDISCSGETALRAFKTYNLIVTSCSFSNSLNNAIVIGSNSSNATITNNVIQNTNTIPGMGLSGDLKGIAIFTNSDNTLIQNNSIINTGYNAIYFSGNNTIIKNNFIDSFCLVKDDGGAIYTYNGSSSSKQYTGRQIIGNIIINGIGAPAGTNNEKKGEANGIYMDNKTTGVQITDNTIINCNNYGIYIHNSSDLVIKNNTMFNNNRQLAMIQDKGNQLIRNNIVAQNIFFSKSGAQSISNIKSAANDIDLFGTFDSNYYAKPLNNKLKIFNNRINNTAMEMRPGAELDAWKNLSQADKTTDNSQMNNLSVANARCEYNATAKNKIVTLDGTYSDVRNNKYSRQIVLPPYSSIVLIRE